MAENLFSNLYEKVYGRQGLLGFPEGTFKNAEGFEPLGLSPARQALLAFASGALANSGRYTDTPQSGLEGIGAGLGSALGMYQSAIESLQDQRQVFQEREQNQELKALVPQLANRARQLGVSEDVIFSAELQANANVRSAITLLNNAISSAKADPELKPSVFEDEQSGRRFLINPKTGAPTEIKDREALGADPMINQEIPASSIASPDYVGEVSSSQPVYDQQGNILGYNFVTKPGETRFVEAKKQAEPVAGEVGPFPEIGYQVELPETDSVMVHKGEGKFDIIPKSKDLESSTPFAYTKEDVLKSPSLAVYGQIMGENDILEVTPGKTPKVIEAKKAEETQKAVQFNYYTKNNLPQEYSSFAENMKDNDVLKVKDGDATVVKGAQAKDDPEKLEFRTKIVKGEDGKTYEQMGYFNPKTAEMVSDFGRVPVKDDGSLTEKDKVSIVSKTLTKPNQRIDNMVVQFDSIASAVGAGESFDDLALIFYIAKMLDPTSVVREGEQLTIRNTGSLGDQMIAWINRVNSGAPFSKTQRRSIINFAKRKIDTELKNYKRSVTTARRQATKLGLSSEIQEGTLGIVHENYDVNPVVQKVMERIAKLPDFNKKENQNESPINEDTPQASATERVIERVKSAVTSESPPENIEDDEELNALLPGG